MCEDSKPEIKRRVLWQSTVNSSGKSWVCRLIKTQVGDQDPTVGVEYDSGPNLMGDPTWVRTDKESFTIAVLSKACVEIHAAL